MTRLARHLLWLLQPIQPPPAAGTVAAAMSFYTTKAPRRRLQRPAA